MPLKPALLLSGFLILFNVGCKQSDHLGNIEYSLFNNTQVVVGIKVELDSGANATIVNSTVTLNPGGRLVIIKSHTQQQPNSLVKAIEIWNNALSIKYKNINLSEYSQDGNIYTFTINLPNTNSAEITKSNTGVHLFLDETSIYGFYPKVEYPRTTYYFNTKNYFEDVFKNETPAGNPNADITMAAVFGTTLISYDEGVYSDKTVFLKSPNGGESWLSFFEFGYSTSDDAFMGAHFIDENTALLFNYTTVFHGQYAETYATDVYKYSSGNITKVSTIDNWCVQTSKFLDENVGYVLVNSPNNTMPADSRNTYFMKTINGGTTWSTPVMISNNVSIFKLFRLDNGKLIAPSLPWDAPLPKYYYVSNDDGQTWQTENVPTTLGIRDIYFLTNGTGYLKTGTEAIWSAQNIGEVYKTTDGGLSWNKLRDHLNGSTIWFYNENIGYLQDLIYTQGQILYVTKDGGITWNEVLYPYDYLIK